MTARDAFYDAAFSSAYGKWDTDPALVADLESVFKWDLDVCASAPNVCTYYYSEAQNALTLPWYGLCWMNPPYGREIGAWVDTARQVGTRFVYADEPHALSLPNLAYLRAHPELTPTVVCLLPSRTDTDWYQRNVVHASLLVNIKGRLKFGSREHWIRHYQDKLIEKYEQKEHETMKGVVYAKWRDGMFNLLDKIGGALCEEPARTYAEGFLYHAFDAENRDYQVVNWRKSTHLKPDAAPFPSCFMVFGDGLIQAQRAKLCAYGVNANGMRARKEL